MTEHEAEAVEELPLEGAGAQLRRARESKGLDLDQVAAETRIPTRHLEVIERGAFNELPARTYAIGFSRTYAKMLGLDEKAIADQVRNELSEHDDTRAERGMSFEPGDPAKVPSSGLAWAGGFAAIILLVGSAVFYSTYYGIGDGPGPIEPDPEPALAANEQPAGDSDAQAEAGSDDTVVFTALEEGVWVKFYDANGVELLQKQMASGERFEIPSDAEGPQIWTGRPDAFAITIDGKSVPKLAEDDFVMRDVAISAEALLARADQTGDDTAIQNN